MSDILGPVIFVVIVLAAIYYTDRNSGLGKKIAWLVAAAIGWFLRSRPAVVAGSRRRARLMERKYFKPKSMTWWAGVASIVAGLIIIALSVVLPDSTVDTEIGVMLITQGAAAIGLRGANG